MQTSGFETYAQFFLSESRSSEAMLPELHGTDSNKLVASDTWRVTVLNQLVDRTTGDVVSLEQITQSRFSLSLTHYTAVIFVNNYLRQGGNVFAGFCLFVCLSVSQQDNSKSYGRIFLKF